MVISTNVEYAGERRMRIRVRSTELVKNESCVSYNESGETEDYKVILMIPDHLEAPVLLTPNDDGKNDFFVIKGINASGGVNKLTILDRLGTVLYTQDGYDNTWRGIDNNGKLLPQDTYYYHYVNGQNIIKGFFEIRY
jgi:gliding motility-associated-like protein